MRRVVTAKEMREIDRRTIKDVGVPSLLLMENAGLGVVGIIKEMLGGDEEKRVIIFCGKGNNGGDGMVVARHLFNQGIRVNVYLFGEKGTLKGDALKNFHILEGFGIKVVMIRDKKDLRNVSEGDLIVDALLGTGVTGEVGGLLAEIIDWINCSSMSVVSVDIPSGLHCDDGSFRGSCVCADQTATMAELKRGLVLPPGRELAGRVTVVDIGAPDFVAQSLGVKTFIVEEDDVSGRLPVRPATAHKGTFGKILILAGSTGMTGAAVLASRASLRVGGGLTILGIPRDFNPVMEGKLTEVMTKPLPQTPAGTLSLEAEGEIKTLLQWADVLAIGPGLSTEAETAELVRQVVVKAKVPMVIDADGINAFSGKASLLEKGEGNRILTPHYGELSRVIGLSLDEISKNRVETARESALRFGSVVVLKGSPTVVASPEGDVYVNPTGNSGMATAGAGDVLTGAIVGLLAQGCSPLDAALCGVFLHGLAGDLGGEILGRRSLVAGDLVDFLGEALCRLEEAE